MAAKLASAPQREEKDDQPEAEKSDKKKEAELQPPKKTEEKKKPRKKSTGSKTSPKLIKSSVPTMDDPIKPITAAEYENLQALLVQFCRVPLLAEFSRPVSLLHPEVCIYTNSWTHTHIRVMYYLTVSPSFCVYLYIVNEYLFQNSASSSRSGKSLSKDSSQAIQMFTRCET
jgi:hypothetical protein